MENELGGYLLIGLIIAALIWYWYDFLKDRAEIARLKQGYEQALKDGNKRLALEYGRSYYGKLRRDGKPTIYDEMKIANDLSVIDGTEAVATRTQPIQEMSKTV